jgi:CPA2 family monovalent cation:H+ antiporter-2
VVVIAGAVYGSHAAAALAERAGFALASSRWLVLCATALCAVPFGLGMLRVSRRMSLDLAERALPSPVRGADLAAAPRRSFALALQLALLGAVALPLLALLQPFLPSLPTLAAALLLCGAFGWALQRGASNLQGHARAAAEVLADALASQSHTAPALAGNAPIEPAEPAALSAARQLLPGMGEPTALRVEAGSRAAGRTLGELRLRGRTGATVLALLRGERVVLMPGAQERLEPGDLLAASGTAEALDAARGELCAPRA